MIFVNVGTDGVIVFEPNSDQYRMDRLTIASAPDDKFDALHTIISGAARHAKRGRPLAYRPRSSRSRQPNGGCRCAYSFPEADCSTC